MKIDIGRKMGLCCAVANTIGICMLHIYFKYINKLLIHSGSPWTWKQYIMLAFFFIAMFWLIDWLAGKLFDKNFFEVASGAKSIDTYDSTKSHKLKRRAVQWVPFLAIVTFIAWFIASFMFGFIEPALSHAFLGARPRSLIDCLKIFFSGVVIIGTISTLIVYFWIEAIWRKTIPFFFPDGILGHVGAEFKIKIRTRLIIAFICVSLLPLPLLLTTAYSNTQAMLHADAEIRMHIASSLWLEIIYLAIICIAIAIFLSIFVSRSVSEPLKNLEYAMKGINEDNLDVRMEIISNDELGTVADGFNDMARRLAAAEKVKESFGKYVSKEIRDEILAGKVALDGEMKRVTLLFSDLRDFTTMVEKHHPTEVLRIINQYFTEMTSAIKSYRGQVLQYVGDEIEAVFGAPLAYDDHPDMAVEAAKEMQRRLIILNKNLEAQGHNPLRHGIGIHTGAVLAGNIGSRDRISYALVGDTVNLASRIEGLTKELGCDIILSQTTHDLLAGKYETEQLSTVQIKGKKEQVMIYKLGNFV